MVVIDLGRQPKLDKKTGQMVMKQCKTQKVFDTLKEAKAYQGENNKAKSREKVSKVAGKATFRSAIADYNKKHSKEWGAAYTSQEKNQARRIVAYFGDTDVRKIDTLAIESYFDWCREPNEVYKTALCICFDLTRVGAFLIVCKFNTVADLPISFYIPCAEGIPAQTNSFLCAAQQTYYRAVALVSGRLRRPQGILLSFPHSFTPLYFSIKKR